MKHPKRYKCSLCKKTYSFVVWAWKHNRAKHDGKAKFTFLPEFITKPS